MGKLSELVAQDYAEELVIIKDAGGNLWGTALAMAFGVAIFMGIGFMSGAPFDRREVALALVIIIFGPFVQRAFKRFEMAGALRHEREVRVEMKLNALLGLVDIKSNKIVED